MCRRISERHYTYNDTKHPKTHLLGLIRSARGKKVSGSSTRIIRGPLPPQNPGFFFKKEYHRKRNRQKERIQVNSPRRAL